MTQPSLNSRRPNRTELDKAESEKRQPGSTLSAAIGLLFLVAGAITFKVADSSDGAMTWASFASTALIVWGLGTIMYAAIQIMRGR